jgi:hypothetical protein
MQGAPAYRYSTSYMTHRLIKVENVGQ